MRIPIIKGVIDRRILVNYRIEPDIVARVLPPPFRPRIVKGFAMGGICLIRLKRLRPRFVPLPWGLGSENAAHRIAVEWHANHDVHRGVYIPRRDTNSWLSTLFGGSVFPGIHHHANFEVVESDNRVAVTARSDDGQTHVQVAGSTTSQLAGSSLFANVEEASCSFESDSLGYSATRDAHRFDGLELRCHEWHVEPLLVESVASSYFEDESLFPNGSAEFDSALLMRDIAHEWHSRNDLCCPLMEAEVAV